MTAPTSDFDYDTIYEDGRADGYESGRDEYAHALALATAERDQARQMLAAAPHGYYCGTVIGNACRCWKAGL